jgi:hypothetical protein
MIRNTRIRRRYRLVGLGVAALSVVIPAVASSAGPTTEQGVAAILGESFMSGVGAGSYAGPVPSNWNSSANQYFCHRSNVSEIVVANLSSVDPAITKTANLACGGANVVEGLLGPQPLHAVPKSQIQQLVDVATADRLKLVVLSFGGNDVKSPDGSITGYADILKSCLTKFAKKAVTPGDSGPCNAVPQAPQVQQAALLVSGGITELKTKIAAIKNPDGSSKYPAGSYRIILQSVPSIMPSGFAGNLNTANGKTDTSDLFAELANNRRAAGCPILESTALAMNQAVQHFSVKIKAVAEAQGVEFLDTRNAFVGNRLCENSATSQSWQPGSAKSVPSPAPVTEMLNGLSFGINSSDTMNAIGTTWKENAYVRPITTLEAKAVELMNLPITRMQHSFHPNALGHSRMGECLRKAYASLSKSETCDSGNVYAIIDGSTWSVSGSVFHATGNTWIVSAGISGGLGDGQVSWKLVDRNGQLMYQTATGVNVASIQTQTTYAPSTPGPNSAPKCKLTATVSNLFAMKTVTTDLAC